MNLLNTISEHEDPSKYIHELAQDPKDPLISTTDQKNQYTVLHSCIILSAGEILITILKIVKEVSDTKKPGLLKKLLGLKDRTKKTPMMLAIQTEYIYGFNLLLDYGSDVNTIEANFSVLQLAARTNKKEFVKKLIDKKADINFSNNFGNALMVSIDSGCDSTFEEQLKLPNVTLHNLDSLNDNYLLKSVNLEMDSMTKLLLRKLTMVYRDEK